MATTTIKKIEIGDLTVIIKKEKTAADRIEAALEWLAGKIEEAIGNTPDWGVGEGSPDNTLPGGGRPPQVGGGPAKPERPVDPGFGVGGRPGSPDNTLPGGGPSGGTKPVDPDEGKPDQGLPGGPGRPSHPIAGQPPQGGTKPVQPPQGGTKPVDPEEPTAEQLPALIRDNMDEIINELLKGTPCDPRPK